MLLSIVECSNYKNYSKKSPPPKRNQVGIDVEIIGPVYAENVAAMRNIGAEMAKGEWIFFKDSDCDIPVEEIKAILVDAPKVDAIGGLYKTENSNYLGQAYHRIQKQWVMQGLDFIRRDRHLLGGALLVKKDAFKQIGGFNREIGWGGEETEFVSKMHELGFKTEVDYRLQVKHDKKMTWKGFLKRAWFQNFNHLYYNIKDNGNGSAFSYLKTSPKYILPVLVFFSFAFMGRLTGWFCRTLEGRRK